MRESVINRTFATTMNKFKNDTGLIDIGALGISEHEIRTYSMPFNAKQNTPDKQRPSIL